MFKSSSVKLFFCLMFSLCSLFSVPLMAEYPDLAGYWNFEDNLLDLSGNDSSGTVSGTAIYNADSVVGKAFAFNGNTFITCGKNYSLNITDNISIEFWLYPEQWVSGYAIHPVNKWTGTGDANYVMYFWGDSAGSDYKKICFYANAGGTWSRVSEKYEIPSLNTWYHIVWTYNSTAGGKLYINGIQCGSPLGSGTLATNAANLTIGESGFNGLIDEVKIYNRVLSSSDVTVKYQDVQTKGYWNLHGNTRDFSGNGNSGTVSGTTMYNSGKVGKAFNFNGSTSIACGNNYSIRHLTDNVSIEAWLYPKQWVSGYATYPICKWTGTGDANYVMYFFGDSAGSDYKKICFYANAGGTWSRVSEKYEIPSLNTWYHIVWTYNSTTGGKLYINGTQCGSPLSSGTLATNTANLTIGESGFNGLIDEVKIYNRVLSSSDVTAKYQDLGTSGVVLENDTLKLTVSAGGKVTELKGKPTNTNYSGGTVDFAKIKKSGVLYSSSSCLQKNDRLLIDFGDANITAELTTKTMGSYIVFQIYSLYGNTTGIEQLQFLNINPSLNTYCDYMSGIRGDDTFTLALRAMNGRADVIDNPVFPGIVDPVYGSTLAKFSLLGSSTSNIRSAFQTMITSEGLARTSQGGPWALDASASKYSYIFVNDITTNNVSSYINLAQTGGSDIIDFYNWWTGYGNYTPKPSLYPNGLADMKTCVDAIHTAGAKASMHCMSALISPYDTSYVSPVPDSRLLKDAQFTLASAIGINDTTIYVNEQPSSTLDTTGQVLQIGNEVITYTGYTQTSPYRFTGCTRGAFGTTKQSPSAGTNVYHFYTCYSAFYPDPDSTLIDEIADSLANVANYCGFDMVYMDGLEGIGSAYGRYKMSTAIFNRIEKSVRVETSCPDHRIWSFYSNVGAWDHTLYGAKKFVDRHVQAVKDTSKTKLLPCQLGWWYLLGFSDDYYSQLPDEVEYLCSKMLGYDTALSHEYLSLSSPDNARQNEYLQMINAYEDLRVGGSVSDTVKTLLKAAGSEFHYSAGTIIKRDNLAHKVTSLSDGSKTWTVNNRFSSQSAKFRIQSLHSDYTTSYNNGPNIILDNFQNAGNFTLTNAPSVTSSLTVNGGIGTYIATNSSGTSVGAWTKASKTFSPVLDISGGNNTIGVWVYGDNKGEVLNFQLYQPGVYDEHYVLVNFTGWKYFEFFLRERDADMYDNYSWPYTGGYPIVYCGVLARNSILNLNIYYNNLPVGQQVSCQIKPVKALHTDSINISNPSISANGTMITFPVTLQSGQYIEFYSTSDCKLYGTNGAFIANVTPTGTVPTLASGNNSVTFNCTGTSGYNERANITMIIDGPQVYPE